jgi:hypothetical protein
LGFLTGDEGTPKLSYNFINCIFGPPSEATVLYGNTGIASITYSCIEGGWPGEGNIDADPMFVDAERGDFRLKKGSPCIDTGDNGAAAVSDTDIAGMRRILYGGKSLTVDMGAYEYYINELEFGPAVDQATLTWSSLPDRSYSIFYSADLLAWHLADGNVPEHKMTTSWIDDGSLTGVPPSLVPLRFYRVLENP